MRHTENDVLGLALLTELEKFRIKMERGETQPGCADWAVRVCQAIVASKTQFGESRACWLAEIKTDL